jgi:dihydrodipicolinate reductase
MTGIVIVGASGRMGRALVEAVIETEGATLVGATVRPESTLSQRSRPRSNTLLGAFPMLCPV